MVNLYEYKINRNRIMTFLEVDVLGRTLERYKYVLSDMQQDPGVTLEEIETMKDMIEHIEYLLDDATYVVEGFDQKDKERYQGVIDRIDEMAGC